MATTRKKLIEVALPLEAINKAAAREKSIRHGHPSTLHLWWARRPLAAARAVIFAQMVDDPSSLPDLFPTEKKQQKERERLFKIMEDLVQWENTTNEEILNRAREEIWQSWRRACADNADHPRADELFDRHKLPAFHDPFAGGGALPLEAQRLGLEAYASDLNPVAVLINKAMIEIPPRFAGRPPVNSEARREKTLIAREWKGAQGLAEDVRYYGKWMRDEAENRIGHLYPKIEVTAEMAQDRPDLKPYVGQQLTVIAWLWARTVKSPNPAFANVDVPLASTFMLSTKAGKEAYVEPVIEDGGYRFTVKVGKPKNAERAKSGTKLSRGANFECLMSGTPISGDYIKAEGKAGRMGARLMAIVAEGERGRVYLAPTPEHETAARKAKPEWRPEVTISGSTQYLGVKPYGMDRFDQLFTDRQLVALTTFSDLVGEAMQQVRRDALAADLPDDATPLRDGGTGAAAYAEAVGVYLAFALSKQADLGNSLCGWEPIAQCPRHVFGRQAIPMLWDYAEGNPLGESSGAWVVFVDGITKAFSKSFQCVASRASGRATQADAGTQDISRDKLVSTDPPYYDNVPYADLSDFFYVWLRQSLRSEFPDLFATLAVPKAEELVAFAYRHEGKARAEAFFLDGMTQAMHRLAEHAHPAFPVTIYYAFKQSESDVGEGTASTGWETFLDAVIRAGFATSGTWPVRTENESRMRGQTSNALASSIVLVCRKRAPNAPTATRREFVAALKAELPTALRRLQEGNIAPVDLAQAAIGPGMAVYTRYAKVLDAEGKPVPVREALTLINQVLDQTLAEQEGDFDADTRFAIAWFEQHGFAEGEFGVAETLSKAKNTSLDGLEKAGILKKGRGKVRLLTPSELPEDWDPATDERLTHWETVHHLIRVLEAGGESAAAALVAKLGSKAETARELAYRLYTICERKKRAAEALAYNALVQSFPEITRLAREGGKPKTEQATLFEEKDR
jgi:putative DNA methylase